MIALIDGDTALACITPYGTKALEVNKETFNLKSTRYKHFSEWVLNHEHCKSVIPKTLL